MLGQQSTVSHLLDRQSFPGVMLLQTRTLEQVWKGQEGARSSNRLNGDLRGFQWKLEGSKELAGRLCGCRSLLELGRLVVLRLVGMQGELHARTLKPLGLLSRNQIYKDLLDSNSRVVWYQGMLSKNQRGLQGDKEPNNEQEEKGVNE